MTQLQKRIFFPLSFFLLIIYIIFLADTANYNIGFTIVKYIPYGDKIMHALLYGTLTVFINYGFNFKTYQSIQVGSLIVLIFATLEEFSQLFISTRTFDFGDLLADLVGIILFTLYQTKRNHKKTLK